MRCHWQGSISQVGGDGWQGDSAAQEPLCVYYLHDCTLILYGSVLAEY